MKSSLFHEVSGACEFRGLKKAMECNKGLMSLFVSVATYRPVKGYGYLFAQAPAIWLGFLFAQAHAKGSGLFFAQAPSKG